MKNIIKKYLHQLVEAKVDKFAKERLLPLIQRKEQEYYDKRWREIEIDNRVDSLEIKLTSNLNIKLYTDSILSKLIYFDTFEKDEIIFLQKFLKVGDVFFDVGANVGLFSLYASSIVATTGQVVAFEPTNSTFSRLTENIALNKLQNVICENIALSNINGEAELQIASGGYDAWNSLAKPSVGELGETQKIETKTLDSYISESFKGKKVDLIKIDVEGWEIPVLDGGKELFSSKEAPTLLVEFTDKNAENAGYTCRQLYEKLQQFGYSLFLYDAKTNSLTEDPIRDDYPYLNLIATKNIKETCRRIS